MADEQYTDRDDRTRRLAAATERGEVMIRDSFLDADGHTTAGASGRLEFAFPAPDDPAIVAARDLQRTLAAKLDDETITHRELVALLRLERGGK